MNDAQIEEVLHVVAQAEADLQSGHEVDALNGLDAAMATLQPVLDWAVAQPDTTLALRLTGSIWPYWQHRGQSQDGLFWLEQALAGRGAADPRLRAQALQGAGRLAIDLGQAAVAREHLQAALALAQTLEDAPLTAEIHEALGMLALVIRKWSRAVTHLGQSLTIRQTLGSPDDLVTTLLSLAATAVARDDPDAARHLLDQAFTFKKTLTRESVQRALVGRAVLVAIVWRNYPRAAKYGRTLLYRSLPHDARMRIMALDGLAAAAIGMGYPEHAALLYGAADEHAAQTGLALAPLTLPDRARRIALVQAMLGGDAWMDQWTAGAQLEADALVEAVEAYARRAPRFAPVVTPRGELWWEINNVVDTGQTDDVVAQTLMFTGAIDGRCLEQPADGWVPFTLTFQGVHRHEAVFLDEMHDIGWDPFWWRRASGLDRLIGFGDTLLPAEQPAQYVFFGDNEVIHLITCNALTLTMDDPIPWATYSTVYHFPPPPHAASPRRASRPARKRRRR